MKNVRTLGICLIAAFALTAIAATTASAERLPAWGQCEATESGTGGRYADSACTQPVRKVYGVYPGGFEWYPLTEAAHESTGLISDLEYKGAAFERGIVQPVSEMTLTFADGRRLTCEGLEPEAEVPLTGPRGTAIAPDLSFPGCHTEAGDACHSIDTRTSGTAITISAVAWENGEEKADGEEGYGPSWLGKLAFVEGRRTTDPSVGMVYKVELPKEHQTFTAQINCEAGEGEQVLSFVIGGHRGGEELTMPITPVNEMSPSFTTEFRQAGGVQQPASLEGHATKPIEALVAAERWEPIGIEATMLFPAEIYEHNAHDHTRHELELKATP
jgi:hypothetical protein